MKKILFILVSSVLVLSACDSYHRKTVTIHPAWVTPRPTPVLANPGKTLQKYNSNHELADRHAIIRRLQLEGVQVLTHGENMRIILESDQMFVPDSSRFRGGQFMPLGDVLALIRLCNIGRPIIVTGYTDNVGPTERNLELSRLQANAVLAYLWSHGDIPLGQLRAHGNGRWFSVADNETVYGSTWNRRVEIQFPAFGA